MARFDVYALADGGLVLDCQSDQLADIGTRFVIPLVPGEHAPPPNLRLNPTVRVGGEDLTMVTQFATTIRASELRARVSSLNGQHEHIVRAIDVLIGAG